MMNLKTFFCISFLLCLSTVFAEERKVNVSGTVLDAENKEPLMGVYVTVGKKGAQTNSKGFFSIKNVEQGEVTLKTMYYSSFPTVEQKICLSKDTSIVLKLKEELLKLEEVVVTGTRTEKRLAETPILTTVIKDREIQKSAAVSTLESLQDNIPGIMVTPNGMGNNMRIKGLNSRYILFLVDGERLVSEGAGGNVNLDQIDVSNIKKIEMINGAASALYGSNAVGAVINIITKEPTHKFESGANIICQSNNTWQTRAHVGVNQKKIQTRVSAFRNASDGFGANSTGAYAARYEDYGGNLKLGYKPQEDLNINILGRYFRHETFNPAGSMNVAHPLSHIMAIGMNGDYKPQDKNNKIRFSVNYDKFFDYDIYEKQENKEKKNNTVSYFSSRIIDTFNPLEKWEFIAGLEYNREENFATKTLGPEPVSKSINDINLFGQAEYEIMKDLDVLAGARYTYNEQFKSAFTPKLSLMYGFKKIKIRGSIGSAFRAPSIKELYYNFNHSGMFWVYGNPDLKAEKGFYSSLSVEYTNGMFNASLAAYYNNISNKITQYDVITPERKNEKYYKNVSSATLQGIDLNVSYIFLRKFVLKGSYSYCDAQDNSTGLQLSSNVKHSGTLSGTWNGKIFKSPFSLQLSGRMNSPKLYQEVVLDDNGKEITEISQSKAYSIWKMVFVKPFRLRKHNLELTLKADNIFNFEETSFVNPGRQYLVGLRYAFK